MGDMSNRHIGEDIKSRLSARPALLERVMIPAVALALIVLSLHYYDTSHKTMSVVIASPSNSQPAVTVQQTPAPLANVTLTISTEPAGLRAEFYALLSSRHLTGDKTMIQ